MDYVIGCDLGSQSLKVVLLSAEGTLAGEASSEYPIAYPYPTWAEQPAEAWFAALCRSVRALLGRTGISPQAVRAVGLAAQVDGVVPVDGAGRPLRPALIWMDRRAVAQCRAVEERADRARLFQITGLNLDASHVGPKIRWLRDSEPEVYRQARYFLLPGSYLAYVLTGALGVDYSNASSTLLMSVRSRAWSDELCALFEVAPQALAPIFPATTVIGELLPTPAGQLGLPAGTPVVLGSGDEHAASLGAGVIRPGLVCDIAGTAEPVCAASAELVFDETGLIETHCHADPELWLLENPGFVSGANYRWFRDEFAWPEVEAARQSGADPYDLLNEQAAQVPPGAAGLVLLPCLMGALTPTWNAAARGTFFGFTLAHTRAHFARAVLEASAYGLRDIVDRMRQIGLPLERIHVVGGGARSRLWRQIKADVTGLPVARLQTSETTALGAALLAQVGAGLAGSLSQAAAQAVQVVEIQEPDPENQARYEAPYQLYRATYAALEPVFEQAAGAA